MSRNEGECSNDEKTTPPIYGRAESRSRQYCEAIWQASRQVAKEMGLTESALRKWVKQSQVDAQSRIEGELTSAEQQELLMLRRELKRVKMERDFLKKAATFFARESSDPTS